MNPFIALSFAASILLLLNVDSPSHNELTPYRDQAVLLWGYRDASGAIVIPPRFLGAGEFADGRAPVEDSTGFAVIDTRGEVIDRIRTDAVAGQEPPPPPARCLSEDLRDFPSKGLLCYADALRTPAVIGGTIVRRPLGTEGASSAEFYRFESGVVLIVNQGYEGFIRRLLLPGVSAEEADRWRAMIYPGPEAEMGCSERWTSGAVEGGAYIEQHAAC